MKLSRLNLIKIFKLELIIFAIRKYKKQEATFKNEMDKMKNDYEEAMKRLENIEKENKKIVCCELKEKNFFK